MKRFTETEKWRDPWFRKLTPDQKCFWQYLCDNCDHAGIWEPDIETASYFIGSQVDPEKALIAFQGRIELLPGGKWRVVKFVKFQYGNLSRDCKPHYPVFACIEKHGYEVDAFQEGKQLHVENGKPIESLSIGFESLQVKVKDKEEVKDKAKFEPPTPQQVADYSREIGYPINGQAWCDSYAQKGWQVGKAKMKDWRAAVRNWKVNGWRPDSPSQQPPIRRPENIPADHYKTA